MDVAVVEVRRFFCFASELPHVDNKCVCVCVCVCMLFLFLFFVCL